MRKRSLAWFVLAALLMTVPGGIDMNAGAATTQEEAPPLAAATGTLRWDFESEQELSYAADVTDTSLREVDTFPSGAWNNQIATTKTVQSLTPHRVQFAHIGRSVAGIVGNTDDYSDASCGGANQTPEGVSLANGGAYCAVVSNVEHAEQPEVLGMTIQLRKEQLLPGREYRLEFDVLSSMYADADSTNGALDLRRVLWAGFGKPSERITDYTELPKWLAAATRVDVDTSNEAEDDNLTRGSQWLHASCVVTADELQFEHGATAFYIGINDPGQTLYPAEKVYFDNITLTLAEEPSVSLKASYGRLWDMEADISGWQPEAGMTALNKDLAEAAKTHSAPAAGSGRCLMAGGMAEEAGAQAALEKNAYTAGQYQLCFYAASDSQDIELYAGINGAEAKAGDGGDYWGYYSLPVSLEEAAFDGSDTATVRIYAKSKSGALVDTLYLDDVRLIYQGADADGEANAARSFFVEGQKPADMSVMTIAALYDGGRLVDVRHQQSGEGTISFAQDCSMEIPSGAADPEVRVFFWETEQLLNLNDTYSMGEAYEPLASENSYFWQGSWNQEKTAVEINFEEAASADGSGWYAAEVYGSDGVLTERTAGQQAVTIGYPVASGSSIRLMRYDQSRNTAELIYTYSADALAESASNRVPAVSHKNMLLRASFETGNLERWWLYRGGGYECTDEVPAHSGNYVLKVDHRQANNTTLMCKINNDDVEPDTVLNVSCWVKKLPQDASARLSIQQMVPATDGNKWKYHNWTTITDNEWHQLTATIDLSQYALKAGGVIDLYISSGDSVHPGFYADDFVISGSKPGEFWDEMADTDPKRSPALSDTPHAINGFYKPLQEDIPALKDVYKDYFKIGAAGWPQMIYDREDERFSQLFLKHFNSYVDNGAFKTGDLLKKQNRNRTDYDFTIADRMMEFATRNGLETIGHVLVWIGPDKDYERLTKEDGTFLTRDEALSFMKENITKIMKHFEGDGDPSEYAAGVDYQDWHIALWDVVNEAVQADGTMKNYPGQGCWYNIVGEEYVNYAFDYADEVCRTNGYDIDLRYNDYSENDQEQIDRTYQLIKDLLADGCRVDTVGMQCHFYASYDTALLRDYVEKIASLGVHIDGTELDFGAYTYAEMTAKIPLFERGITKERELTQANLVYDTMQIFKEYHEIVDRVVFWTVYDGVDWWDTRSFNHVDYAGLFDREYQAKPLYWAVADPEYFEEYYQSGAYLDSQ